MVYGEQNGICAEQPQSPDKPGNYETPDVVSADWLKMLVTKDDGSVCFEDVLQVSYYAFGRMVVRLIPANYVADFMPCEKRLDSGVMLSGQWYTVKEAWETLENKLQYAKKFIV